MLKMFYFAISCLLPIVIHCSAWEIQPDKIQAFLLQEETETRLQDVTCRYLDFINSIGGGEFFSHAEVAATLLNQDCKKIFNGNLYTENRDDFVADLLSVNVNQGCWSVHAVDIIISAQKRASILRLIIKMETSEIFTAIVILRFNESDLITEINEVFNKIGNPYDFEGERT